MHSQNSRLFKAFQDAYEPCIRVHKKAKPSHGYSFNANVIFSKQQEMLHGGHPLFLSSSFAFSLPFAFAVTSFFWLCHHRTVKRNKNFRVDVYQFVPFVNPTKKKKI